MIEAPSALENILGQRFKRPLYLATIEMTNTVIRYASARQAVSFPHGGSIYFAKGFRFSGVSERSAGRITVQFNDGDQALQAFNDLDNFKGKKISIVMAFRDALDNSENKLEIFAGRIETTKRSPASFSISAFRSGSLRIKSPRRVYGRRCPWQPGGPECNHSGLLNNSTTPLQQIGIATVSGAGLVITDANRTEAADYWNFGSLVITHAGAIYKRRVADFASGALSLDIALPVEEGGSVEYTLQGGCDGSYEACGGSLAYGPTGDNTNNYGGFLHTETEVGN